MQYEICFCRSVSRLPGLVLSARALNFFRPSVRFFFLLLCLADLLTGVVEAGFGNSLIAIDAFISRNFKRRLWKRERVERSRKKERNKKRKKLACIDRYIHAIRAW